MTLYKRYLSKSIWSSFKLCSQTIHALTSFENQRGGFRVKQQTDAYPFNQLCVNLDAHVNVLYSEYYAHSAWILIG